MGLHLYFAIIAAYLTVHGPSLALLLNCYVSNAYYSKREAANADIMILVPAGMP